MYKLRTMEIGLQTVTQGDREVKQKGEFNNTNYRLRTMNYGLQKLDYGLSCRGIWKLKKGEFHSTKTTD